MFHEAAERNVAAALRHFARHASGSVVAERAGTLLVAAGTPYVGAFHDAALRVDRAADAAGVVDEVIAFGAHRTLWAAPDHDQDDPGGSPALSPGPRACSRAGGGTASL